MNIRNAFASLEEADAHMQANNLEFVAIEGKGPSPSLPVAIVEPGEAVDLLSDHLGREAAEKLVASQHLISLSEYFVF